MGASALAKTHNTRTLFFPRCARATASSHQPHVFREGGHPPYTAWRMFVVDWLYGVMGWLGASPDEHANNGEARFVCLTCARRDHRPRPHAPRRDLECASPPRNRRAAACRARLRSRAHKPPAG
jgi:hypothetical protein